MSDSNHQGFKIVEYSPTDLDEIMEIEVEAFTAAWSRSSYEELIPMDTVKVWVAKISDEVVGYMLVQFVVDEMELHTFAVKDKWRKQGIGRKLMEFMFDRADELGAANIYLMVRLSNISAKTLYAKMGFEPIGIRKSYYYDNGEDAIVLKKVLRAIEL